MAESPWDEMYRALAWLPGGRLNIAHEAIDRHANGRLRDKTALMWQGASGERETYTFGQLKRLTNQFAHVLMSLGIGKGDPVFTYMTRVPELYVALLGTLKTGAIAAPLFSGLAPEAVKHRLQQARCKVLVAQPHLRRRMAPHIPELWDLQHIVVADRPDRGFGPLDMADLSYVEEMSKSPLDFEVEPMSQYDHALLHYTSGGAGAPKGVLHCQAAAAQHRANGRSVLGLRDDDVYWCTADPGFVTGTSCGVLAPWTNGVTQLVYEDGFDPEGWYEAIRRNRVTVWYTAPAALDMLMGSGEEVLERYDTSSLRSLYTVGGHAGKATTDWAERVFGSTPRSTWAQTETGAVLIAGQPGADAPAGSMGQPTPGVEAAVLDDDYEVVVDPSVQGHLAVRPGWPSMFRGYWDDEGRYNARFRKGWYISGDRARRDEGGYFWFEGRDKDED